MDLSVRERLRAAQGRRDVQALKNAYELIKSAHQGRSALDSSDNFSTDLYVLCAEQAFQFSVHWYKSLDFKQTEFLIKQFFIPKLQATQILPVV